MFEVRFSFLAVAGFMVCTDRDGTMLLCALSCALHECGHLAVMMLRRRPPTSVALYGGGIHIRGGSTDILTVSAGCAVNAALFLASVLPEWGSREVRLFGVINLLTGAFNLLPLRGLDGKRLLELTCIRLFPPEKAVRVCTVSETVMTVLILPVVIVMVFSGMLNFSALIFFFYILVVEILEKI